MSPRQRFARLLDGPPVVLPSMLLCDFGRLADEIHAVESAGARGLHLDVMDGYFVPNMTYGMTIVRAVREATELPLDVHLMIHDPIRYIDEFADAGADALTIHVEAADDPRAALEKIRERDVAAGIALNPPTALVSIADVLPFCDLVLPMSVMPGYGGQKFDPAALDKLRSLKSQPNADLLLEVDGGVNADTIAQCAEAGARLLVVGSAIFRNAEGDYAAAISQLTDLASC
ncbi:ribulose-phosphate 3-epimerase [Pirellulales bacterium]|nr:ribulose-phosphate 3-epimerase [Pirellulales bacterium]